MGEDRIVYKCVPLPTLAVSAKDYIRELKVEKWHKVFRGFLKALDKTERGNK